MLKCGASDTNFGGVNISLLLFGIDFGRERIPSLLSELRRLTGTECILDDDLSGVEKEVFSGGGTGGVSSIFEGVVASSSSVAGGGEGSTEGSTGEEDSTGDDSASQSGGVTAEDDLRKVDLRALFGIDDISVPSE